MVLLCAEFKYYSKFLYSEYSTINDVGIYAIISLYKINSKGDFIMSVVVAIKKDGIIYSAFFCFGGDDWDRTSDLMGMNHTL